MGILSSASAESNHVEAALAEARRSTRPLIWFATAAECFAAAATIASKVPLWLVSPILVGIPLLTFAIVQWRRARAATKQLRQLYHYDRQYLRYVTSWVMSEGPDPNYWAGTHHAERKMVALRPISYFTWNITRRSDDDNPFSGVTVTNRQATRSGDGLCTFKDPHKQSSNFTFRVEFEPSIRPGETVELSFDVFVPKHKCANVASLSSRPRPTIPSPGGSDYSSTDISYPIEEFIKEVVIPENLRSRAHGVQTLMKTDFPAEKEHLDKTGGITISRVQVDEGGAWKVRVERKQPPIGCTYRVVWMPPD